MRYLKLFYLIGICVLMAACSQTMEDAIMESQPKALSPEISLEEALATADRMFAELDGTTRSGAREVSSIQTLTVKTSTRGEDIEFPAYYLVNYGEEDGFAVLSANRHLGSVFAIGEEGRLQMEDTVDNKILAHFFNGLDSYASSASLSLRDSVTVNTGRNDTTIYQALIPKERVFPKLPKTIQYWFGGAKTELYNTYPKSAICIAQAMAYFGKPAIWESFYYGNVELNWALIQNYQFNSNYSSSDAGYKEIQKLLDLIVESFFDYNWPLSPSKELGFELGMIHPMEERLGYDIKSLCTPASYAGGHCFDQPYWIDVDMWIRALNEGRLITVSDFKGCKEVTSGIGCVVDGFIRFDEHPTLSKYNTDTMFHCVWGRGRMYNGYFAILVDGYHEEFVFDPVSRDSGIDIPMDISEDEIFEYITFKPKNI